MDLRDIVTGIGMVLVIEGLVYALAPSLVERLREALREMPPEMRRKHGVLTVVTGVVILWSATA